MKRTQSSQSKRVVKKRKNNPLKKITGKVVQPLLKDSFQSTHIYFEPLVTLNPGSGLAAVYVFSANGLYDPNISGVGHQAMGFDQMSALYQEYLVKGCYVKAQFVNSEAAAGAIVGFAFTQTASSSADIRQYIENGNCYYTVVGSSGGKDCATVTGGMDISKMAGFNVDSGSEYAGGQTYNPTAQIYCHVFALGITGGDPGQTQASVELRYEGEWRRPILASTS